MYLSDLRWITASCQEDKIWEMSLCAPAKHGLNWCTPHIWGPLWFQKERKEESTRIREKKLERGALRGKNIWGFWCFRIVANWVRWDGQVYVLRKRALGTVTLQTGNSVTKQQVIHCTPWPEGRREKTQLTFQRKRLHYAGSFEDA